MNVHLVKRDPVTIVDAGPATPEAWDALVKGLARAGLEPRDVKRVVVTHGHHDHFGLAERLAQAGARVSAGRRDSRALGMRRGSPALLRDMARSGFGLGDRFRTTLFGAGIDALAQPLSRFEPLDGGETLPGDGWELHVLAAPGHTPGSLVFILPEAGILFTGDTVLERITPNAVVIEDPDRRGELFVGLEPYLKTLERLREPARRLHLLTGHGAAVASLEVRLRDVKRRYAARAAAITRNLGGQPRTVREVVRALFPRLDAVNLFLAYSEVRGFMAVLEARGLVRREPGITLDRWRLAA